MAQITRRGDSWQARIRRIGTPTQVRTFRTKAAADRWARAIEQAIDAGAYVPTAREAERITIADALDRYAREVTARKRNNTAEKNRIRWIKTQPIAARTLAGLRPSDVATLRDGMAARDLSPNTIRLHLAPLSHLYRVARTDWGMDGLANPVRAIRLPSVAGTARDRRLKPGELEALQTAPGAPAWFAPLVLFAVETAMRRSEIAGLRDHMIAGNIATLAITKNGEARRVPLSPAALQALDALRATLGSLDRMPNPNTLSHAFIDACRAAGIDGLRLHDLRREGTSRLFERGLALPEVAAITGHKTWAMLAVYTKPRAEDLVCKLAKKKPAGTKRRAAGQAHKGKARNPEP